MQKGSQCQAPSPKPQVPSPENAKTPKKKRIAQNGNDPKITPK